MEKTAPARNNNRRRTGAQCCKKKTCAPGSSGADPTRVCRFHEIVIARLRCRHGECVKIFVIEWRKRMPMTISPIAIFIPA